MTTLPWYFWVLMAVFFGFLGYVVVRSFIESSRREDDE